jgi:hypothetical protein
LRLRLQIIGALQLDEEIAAISRVVAGVEDGWHDWLEPDPGDLRLEAYYEQNPTHRELLSKSFTAALAYGPPQVRTLTVVVHGDAPGAADAWPLAEALVYLAQPLEILVENARNDGKFFHACWSAVAPHRSQRFAARRPGAFFSQGGGKAEVLQLINHRTQEALDRRSVPPRIFVLLDSDARYPGHLDRESRQLLDVCAELGIPITLSQKRSIENYVGDDALRDVGTTYPETQPSVDFLISLTKEQRDHYPVKKGFEGPSDSPTLTSDVEKELYSGVAWPTSFKPKLRRLMEHVLGDKPLISYADLAGRGAVEELRALAERIDEEI